MYRPNCSFVVKSLGFHKDPPVLFYDPGPGQSLGVQIITHLVGQQLVWKAYWHRWCMHMQQQIPSLPGWGIYWVDLRFGCWKWNKGEDDYAIYRVDKEEIRLGWETEQWLDLGIFERNITKAMINHLQMEVWWASSISRITVQCNEVSTIKWSDRSYRGFISLCLLFDCLYFLQLWLWFLFQILCTMMS